MNERVSWRERANCRGRSTLMFATGYKAETAALFLCRHCPVQAQCLAATMEYEGTASHHFRYGVAGGLTARARDRLAHGRWLGAA